MNIILTILLCILSVGITATILLQPHKSEGMTSLKSSDSSIFGVSTDGGPLAKMTVFMSIALALVVLSLNYYYQ